LTPYLKKPIQLLYNCYLYELTQHNIDTLIINKFKAQDNNIIKILDVPVNYDTKLLVKYLANVTKKEIKTYREFKKRPQRIINKNNPKAGPTYIKSPYKHVLVSFVDKTAINYLLQKDEWGLNIEDFFVRILPANSSHEEYTKRTTSYYKITGVPLNANVFDLKPLLTYLKGRTCTFTQTNRSSITKNAFIYVHPDDLKQQNLTRFSTTFSSNKKLFIYPSTDLSDKTCRVCGDHSHVMNKCPSPDFFKDKNDRTIFRRSFIQRNSTKITSDEKTRTTYNHIIQLNTKQTRQSSQQSRPSSSHTTATPGSSSSTTFSRSPQRHASASTNSRNNSRYSQINTITTSRLNNNDTLRQEVESLRVQLNTMAASLLELTENQSSHSSKISHLEKQVSVIESQLTDINNKQSIIETATTDNGQKLDQILSHLTASSTVSHSPLTHELSTQALSRPAPYNNVPYQQFKSQMNPSSRPDSPSDLYQDSYTDNDDMSDSHTIQEIITPDPSAPPAKSLLGGLMSNWSH
jgi:hypothetical protein